MKAQQVNITISGIAGSGRLSITYLIKKLLKENNFEVDFNRWDFAMKMILIEKLVLIMKMQ